MRQCKSYLRTLLVTTKVISTITLEMISINILVWLLKCNDNMKYLLVSLMSPPCSSLDSQSFPEVTVTRKNGEVLTLAQSTHHSLVFGYLPFSRFRTIRSIPVFIIIHFFFVNYWESYGYLNRLRG